MFKNSIYYYFGHPDTKLKKNLMLLLPLFAPFLIIAIFHTIFRFNTLKYINPIFWVVLIISSIWFVIGPRFVFNFINLFVSFKENPQLSYNVREYFKNNEAKHYKRYKIYLIVGGTIFSIVGIVPIIVFPDILTENITNGLCDPFFWLIICFIIWFLFYTANAIAFILLINFNIIQDLKEDKVFIYNPVNITHHKSLDALRNLCNKSVAYTCSGLLFIPLAIYFIFQQPELNFNVNNKKYEFISTSQSPIYLIWVICLLIIYCFFLFLSITYPNYELKKYVKCKNNDFLLREEYEFIKSYSNLVKIACPKINFWEAQINQYNAYLRLQEIKIVCQSSFNSDIETLVTYISIIVTIISIILGFVQMF